MTQDWTLSADWFTKQPYSSGLLHSHWLNHAYVWGWGGVGVEGRVKNGWLDFDLHIGTSHLFLPVNEYSVLEHDVIDLWVNHYSAYLSTYLYQLEYSELQFLISS